MPNGSSRLQYTSEDYQSIFNDLKNAIPELTDQWDLNAETEAGPGTVLVKLISMLGDMLSFNKDKERLEVYPASVTQRKNAQQVFELADYKMHWYQSAVCNMIFNSISSGDRYYLPNFTEFISNDNSIHYSYFNTETGWGTDYASQGYSVNLVQGKVIKPDFISGFIPDSEIPYGQEKYDFNASSNIIDSNNRIYFKDITGNTYSNNIDESHIILIDANGDQWTQLFYPDNVDLVSDNDRYFEFGVDEYDDPYIRLINGWENFYGNTETRFKLFYIISDGQDGRISQGRLTRISKPGEGTQSLDSIGQIYNESSIGGFNPETANEARLQYRKYLGTINTLITLQDFTNAVSRSPKVLNCIALDLTNDPNLRPVGYYDPLNPDLEPSFNEVNIYVVPIDGADDSSFTEEIINSYIDNKNHIHLKFNIVTPENKGGREFNIYSWSPSGYVYLREAVSPERARDIITEINNNLYNTFKESNVNFNESINYIDVISTIVNTNPIILSADIDQVTYYEVSNPSTPITDKSRISGQRNKEFTKSGSSYSPGGTIELDGSSFTITLNERILNGSLTIQINNGQSILIDDGNGKFYDNEGTINNYSENSINYSSGTCKFTVNGDPSSINTITIIYKSPVIGITKFSNSDELYIAPECIR